ncbi:FAD-binding protein [Bacteriovoracaceae bacterium]|nr:FAD-binding protein [Bacteriovoracaceae bacterium]
MRKIFLTILVIINSANSIAQSPQSQYREAAENLNFEIEVMAEKKLCPGVRLVKSCGNLVCEKNKRETIKNCPSDCLKGVKVRSYNNIILCQDYVSTQIPINKEEVQDIIKKAIFKKSKVKVIGKSHSATDILCSKGLALPMEKFDKVLGITDSKYGKVVEAESGITVFKLSEWLSEKGYALKGIPHMGFRDVSIGGAIATASHGSTPKHTGVLSNIVMAMEFVDGKGNIQNREYDEDLISNQKFEFKALRASLGLLGVVTKMKLLIQPQFNLHVKTSYHRDSTILKRGLLNSIADCDFGQFNWFPGSNKIVKTCGAKTADKAKRGAQNRLLDPAIPPFLSKPFKQILQLGTCNNRVMCLMERVRYWQFKLQPPFVYGGKKKKKRYSHNLVGKSHRMVSSHLTKSQAGFFQMDWELAVPEKFIQPAFEAIYKMAKEKNICLPLVGVFIRFAPIDDATLIGHTSSLEKGPWQKGKIAAFFEMPVYIPLGFSKKKFDQYEKKYRDFANMLIKNFHGRPHWGKNKTWTFEKVKDQGTYQTNLEQFKKIAKKFDPNKIFTNKFSSEIGLTN